MKIGRLAAAVIVAAASVARAADFKYTNNVYLAEAGKQFHQIVRAYNTTPFGFYLWESKDSTNTLNVSTNYTITYHWSNRWPAGDVSAMNVLTGAVSAGYVEFTPTAATFDCAIDRGYAGLLLSTGSSQTVWCHGQHTTLLSPEIGVTSTFSGVTNVDWAGYRYRSPLSAPVIPDGVTMSYTTNAAGQLVLVADQATGTATNVALADLTDTMTASNIPVGDGTHLTLRTPAEVRDLLDVVIGTNAQAYSANLTTLAALNGGALTNMASPMTNAYPNLDTDGTDDFLADGSVPLSGDVNAALNSITNVGTVGATAMTSPSTLTISSGTGQAMTFVAPGAPINFLGANLIGLSATSGTWSQYPFYVKKIIVSDNPALVATGGTPDEYCVITHTNITFGTNTIVIDFQAEKITATAGIITNFTYYGNAAGLTNFPIAVLSSSLMTNDKPVTVAQLPAAVVTNGEPASITAAMVSTLPAWVITNGQPASVTATMLSNTTVTAGSYGNASNVCAVTFDADGRATAAANVAVQGEAGAYGAGWNGDNNPPTKDAVYDKVSAIAHAELQDLTADDHPQYVETNETGVVDFSNAAIGIVPGVLQENGTNCVYGRVQSFYGTNWLIFPLFGTNYGFILRGDL